MAQEALKSAAAQANLSPREVDQINALGKMLSQHRTLSGMPKQIAQQEFAKLPKAQQDAQLAMFGNEDPTVEQKRGWLGSAFHYIGEGVKNTVLVPFRVANEASDLMTRLYRTGAIAMDQNVDLVKAFDIANDKGDKVFSPGRISEARNKYGLELTDLAVKIASGQPIDQIQAEGTEAQKQLLTKYYNKNGIDPLFQDTLDAVQAAKYSPGRQLANLILPAGLEGSGLLYKGIAGVTDAAYRIFTDPTLLLGKAKKAYDAGDWLLFNLVGKPKGTYGRNLNQIALSPANVDRYFSDPRSVNLWNQYGQGLKQLEKARLTGSPELGAMARMELKRIAPEYGDATISELLKAGVRDAATARNFLQNHVDARNILRGNAARKTPLLPIMDAPRKLRITALTTGNKVLNIKELNRDITQTLYGKGSTYEDIATGIGTKAEDIAYLEKDLGKIRKSDGAWRFSLDEVNGKIDKFSRKFNFIPNFRERSFDVMAKDATEQVYRLSVFGGLNRYHSRVISEVFDNAPEGERREIFSTLFSTVINVRQGDKGEIGQLVANQLAGKNVVQEYAPDLVIDGVNKGNPAFIEALQKKVGLTDADLSSRIAVPSIQDIDINTARTGIYKYIVGTSLKRPMQRITDYWVFGTLATPRTVVRNASEDAIAHLAIGESPFGLTKSRMLTTKFNQIREGMAKLTQDEITAAKEIVDIEKQLASVTDDTLKSGLELTLKEKRNAFQSLEGKKADWSQSKLGFFNKVVRRSETERYRKDFALAIAEGRDPVEAARKVMAAAVADTKLAGTLGKSDYKYFDMLMKHGNVEDSMDEVTQGSISYAQNADYVIATKRDIAEYGDVAELVIDGKRYAQAKGLNNYGQFDPVVSTENRISWMMQIGRMANSPLDRIAIANLDTAGDDKAINAVVDALKALTPTQKSRYEINGVISDQEWASKIVARAKNYFVKRDGKTLNEDLLNKVRFTSEDGTTKVSSEFLRLEDIPGIGNPELAPQWISGKVLMPMSGSDNFGASIMDKTYGYMAEANGRFTRQNVVTYEATRALKEMEESGWMQRAQDIVMQGRTPEEAVDAWEYAMGNIVETALETARERTLAYVDNPAIRTQLAFTSRNLARFFRATEDFYRRAYRTVRYNPEAISRLALTYEGITHSGWVQQDDQGEDYFFYPGLNPVYKTMASVFDRFGIKNGFQIPMPVEFGAKLKMLTPSMNPDSLFPTFAGPIAALPMKAVFALVPSLQKFETTILGQYGEDQPLINAALPSHVNRLLATLNRDERNSQYASAFRKGATYAEAAGHAPQPKFNKETGEWEAPTEAEMENYRQTLESATITVLGLRFVTGLFLPAPSQITLKSDMAQWARDNGRVNMKQAFNNLIKQYGSMDKAAEEWIRLYPKEIPYMISESESKRVASVRAVNSAASWIEQNGKVLKDYPEGGAFLIPQQGDFDFDAYRILSKSGLRESKTLSDFMLELQTSKDIKSYYQYKDQYDTQLSATFSTDAKRVLREQWQIWSDQFFGARPLVKQQFIRQTERKLEKQRAFEDLTNMVNDPNVTTQPKTKAILKQMVDIYNEYDRKKNTFAGGGEDQKNLRDMMKIQTKEKLEKLASSNMNAQSAYNILFSSLIGD